MSRHRRRSGPAFWIATFLVGILSPNRGKRRINAQMTELHERAPDLEDDNRFLRSQLAEVTVERDLLKILAAGRQETPPRATGKDTTDTDNESTVTFPVYTPPEVVEHSDNTKLTTRKTEAMSPG